MRRPDASDGLAHTGRLNGDPHTFRTAHPPAAIIEALGAADAAAVLGGNLDALLGTNAPDHDHT